MSTENEENTVEEVVESLEIAESSPESEGPEFTSIEDLRNIDLDDVESAPGVVVNEETGEVETPWSPDYTYKVKDEVMEFPEHLRSVIASKEHENELRDLYTKAHGLDLYKEKHGELEERYTGAETELNELKPQLNQLVDGYRNIKELRDSKDYHKLIETLNWDKDELIDFAEQLLSEEELPEDQKVAIASNRKLENEVELLRHQVDNFQVQGQSQQLQAEQSELGAILANEVYAESASLLKEVGIDMEADVISLGTQMFNESDRKVYPSVGDVVAKAFENRQGLLDRLAPQQTNTAEEAQPVVQTQKVVQRQPTLPKVTGTNNNVLDEVFSLDKLRELSDTIPNRTYK